MKFASFFWTLAREVGEEKAKAVIADFVREMNEEVQQYVAGPGAARLDQLLEGTPPELALPLRQGIIELVTSAGEEAVQPIVDKLWSEVEKFNPSDAPAAAPVVDFTADE